MGCIYVRCRWRTVTCKFRVCIFSISKLYEYAVLNKYWTWAEHITIGWWNRGTGVGHTYLLTPCSRVLLEKLTGSVAIQEILIVFGTRRFLIVFTSARHLSLSWANSIQSPQPPPTSWRSILILSSHLRLGLPNGLFPSGFPTRTLSLKRQIKTKTSLTNRSKIKQYLFVRKADPAARRPK